MTDERAALIERAEYYELLADDIRKMNGHSVDADYSDETARVLREASAALTRLAAELLAAKAQLTARAKLMVTARDRLINIRDTLDDEGDRVFFGSTNDADLFRDFVEALDDWKWHDILADSKAPDYMGQLKAAREEARALREALKAISEGRIDLQFNETTDRPMWHVAFVQLQSIARAALARAKGEAE